MKKDKTKRLIWILGIATVVLAASVFVWIHHFRSYTPAEVALDLRAGIAARNAEKPVERFLELRYGPLTDPANRQKAFIDFFNVGHIEGLHLLVNRMDESRKRERIAAMAEWIANYRQTMTPEEKKSLAAYLHSDGGRQQLRQATDKFLNDDVRYRSATAPVIAEIMTTLVEVQNP